MNKLITILSILVLIILNIYQFNRINHPISSISNSVVEEFITNDDFIAIDTKGDTVLIITKDDIKDLVNNLDSVYKHSYISCQEEN